MGILFFIYFHESIKTLDVLMTHKFNSLIHGWLILLESRLLSANGIVFLHLVYDSSYTTLEEFNLSRLP